MALTDNLVAYWTLDESSGNRADSVGSSTLTDNNTVLAATGKQGNGADFERDNSEYLSCADNAAVSTGDVDVTWAFWFNSESSGDRVLLSKWNGSTNDREYIIEIDATDIYFSVSASGTGTGAQVSSTSLANISTGTWYFVVCWHDATANTINMKVNNGTTDSASWSGGIRDGGGAFNIGARADGGGAPYFDGIIDEVGIWKRVLTSDEMTTLYNGGTGTTYPFTVAATGVTGRLMMMGMGR